MTRRRIWLYLVIVMVYLIWINNSMICSTHFSRCQCIVPCQLYIIGQRLTHASMYTNTQHKGKLLMLACLTWAIACYFMGLFLLIILSFLTIARLSIIVQQKNGLLRWILLCKICVTAPYHTLRVSLISAYTGCTY